MCTNEPRFTGGRWVPPVGGAEIEVLPPRRREGASTLLPEVAI